MSQEIASVRSKLRTSTADHHRRLDETVSNAEPFGRHETYHSFLAAQQRAWARLADRFGGLAHDHRWALRTAESLRLLRDDLHDLDGAVSAPTDEADVEPTGVCHDPSSGLALQYVFHGSAFGGRALAREVESALGARTPRRFLARAAAAPGHWKEFLAELDAFGCTTMMIDVARTAFDVHHEEFVSGGVTT